MILQAIIQMTDDAYTSGRYEVMEAAGEKYVIFGKKPGGKLLGIRLVPAKIYPLAGSRPKMFDYKGDLAASEAVILEASECREVSE